MHFYTFNGLNIPNRFEHHHSKCPNKCASQLKLFNWKSHNSMFSTFSTCLFNFIFLFWLIQSRSDIYAFWSRWLCNAISLLYPMCGGVEWPIFPEKKRKLGENNKKRTQCRETVISLVRWHITVLHNGCRHPQNDMEIFYSNIWTALGIKWVHDVDAGTPTDDEWWLKWKRTKRKKTNFCSLASYGLFVQKLNTWLTANITHQTSRIEYRKKNPNTRSALEQQSKRLKNRGMVAVCEWVTPLPRPFLLFFRCVVCRRCHRPTQRHND